MISSYLTSILQRENTTPYTVTDNAPETYNGLLSIGHLYIYGGASDSSIYGSPANNHLFRAHHDSIHLAKDFAFDNLGEYLVARETCRIFSSYSSIAAEYIWADVYGQVKYNNRHGVFPTDQLAFVEHYMATSDVEKKF